MTRLGTVFWVVVVLAAGFTTFKVKYAVQDIEDARRTRCSLNRQSVTPSRRAQRIVRAMAA